MRCERAQDLFSDYCEGHVSQALLVPLESHLEECAVCRSQVRDLRDLWHMLDTTPHVEPPSDFRAAVWRRIEDSQRRPARPSLVSAWRRMFARPALAWGLAALLLVLLAGAVVPIATVGASLNPFSWFSQRGNPAPLEISEARYQVTGTQVLLVVGLRCTTDRTVDVRAADPAVRMVGPSSRVKVGPQTPTLVTLELMPGTQLRSVGILVAEPGADAGQKLDVALPAR